MDQPLNSRLDSEFTGWAITAQAARDLAALLLQAADQADGADPDSWGVIGAPVLVSRGEEEAVYVASGDMEVLGAVEACELDF